MFRDDRQLAAVCQALCDRTTALGVCWTIDPPGITARNRQLLRRFPHSHGERLLYDIAWALWNGRRKPDFYEMVNVLDRDNLLAVGEILSAIAFGSDGIDAWLNETAFERAARSTGGARSVAAETPRLPPGAVQPAAAGSDALARVKEPGTPLIPCRRDRQRWLRRGPGPLGRCPHRCSRARRGPTR